MKVMLTGQVLSVRVGKTKAGKDYSVADVYDGEELIKVFGVDPKLLPGNDLQTFPVRIRLRDDGSGLFVSVTK